MLFSFITYLFKKVLNMLEREYDGYGFNEPERFETMAM
nr:MAG TPA: hypothetical protein [Ackermannviridae sp.]